MATGPRRWAARFAPLVGSGPRTRRLAAGGRTAVRHRAGRLPRGTRLIRIFGEIGAFASRNRCASVQ